MPGETIRDNVLCTSNLLEASRITKLKDLYLQAVFMLIALEEIYTLHQKLRLKIS